MNSLIWKGVSSTSIKGLIICDLPPITKPQMRTAETVIDGKDGSVIEELGYASYDKIVPIGLRGDFNIDEVMKYFTGEGEIIFSNEPDKVYSAKIAAQIDFNRLLRYRQANIIFRVQPYKHKYNEALVEAQTETVTASGASIVLDDCGNSQMKITTDAEKVFVHGKNLLNPNAFMLSNNSSFEVQENGYKLIAVGGSDGAYTASRYKLPLTMCGKSYCMQCDEIIYAENPSAIVQVTIITPSNTYYPGITNGKKSVDLIIPEDATDITVGIWTNNTSAALPIDNKVIVYGLRITPIEYKNDAWIPFTIAQESTVEDGIAIMNSAAPITVISNNDNSAMTVEYYKAFNVFNEGLEYCKPLMILRGNGTVEISVNGVGAFSYTFPEGERKVIIDSEKEEAYLGAVLKNRNMNGEFPTLLPQNNVIGWKGNIESMHILPRSRWL